MAGQKYDRNILGELADLLGGGHAVNILHLDIKENSIEFESVLEAPYEFAPVSIEVAAYI